MCGWLSRREWNPHQTVYILEWAILFPLSPQKIILRISCSDWGYSYTYTPSWLNINRNVWNRCAGPRLPPPLHLYVYTSCKRPSIYGQLKNTNNHPPPVKNLLLSSAKFCDVFVYAHAAIWLPVYYYSVSAEPMGIRPSPERCQAFPSPFPVCDIIVYSPKTHWSVSCLQPGWHTSHAKRGFKHKVHVSRLWPFGRASKGASGRGQSRVACLNRGVIPHDQHDETLTL